ncbi:hypothetical protein OSCT_0270 [Oscillochloris trichoides DG-6]|uniref:LTD domain-containing protein n=1 Tax=Oscillochloris trichoides DG-6 TaxID=765420 RepID=E1IAB9_9CHLR|nr:lamin tail domain-containing protein [Oscillochloris trichoides]EFO81873.1 hypothetical protein OSCT_0270 [Oscillochloris trichoides DG-6]
MRPAANAATNPIPLACPNQSTVIISGEDAPAGESLIAYLDTRPVGGDSVRPDGRWRIPLHINERPGIYPVEVKLRTTRALVASFTCYVDQPTPTSLVVAGDPHTNPTPPTESTALPTTTLGVIAPPTSAPTPTAQPVITSVTVSPTQTSTPTRTVTVTASPISTQSPTPTRTLIPDPGLNEVEIGAIFCRDRTDRTNESEVVDLNNTTNRAITLTGWRLVNTSRDGIVYTFPTYTMNAGPNFYISVYSGVGQDVIDTRYADFFWNRTEQLWFPGDQAALYNASGQLMATYVVPLANCQ